MDKDDDEFSEYTSYLYYTSLSHKKTQKFAQISLQHFAPAHAFLTVSPFLDFLLLLLAVSFSFLLVMFISRTVTLLTFHALEEVL